MKQLLQNYTFNTTAKTITCSDFNSSQPLLLSRLLLIEDATTNKILYNEADNTVTTAAISSYNVITLGALQGGETNTDSLAIFYDTQPNDPNYSAHAPVIEDNSSSIKSNTSAIDINTTDIPAIKTDLDEIALDTDNLPLIKSDTDTIVTETTNTSTATGSQSDAVYTSGSGSIIAILKGLFSKLATIVTNTTNSSATGIFIEQDNNATIAKETGGNLASIAADVAALGTLYTIESTQTNKSQVTQIADGSGNVIASTSNALNVQVENTSIPVTGTFYPATQDVSIINASMPITPVIGTFWQATQPISGTVGSTSHAVNVGQVTVGTTAVQLATSSTVPTNGIIIGALSTNTASIFIGGSGVSTTNGMEILPGGSVPFTCNLSTLYIISASSTTDKIWWNVT